MIITGISDTHNKHKQLMADLPGGDLIIHAGDFTSIGRKREIQEFIKWFGGLNNYTHKVFIAGNHDLQFDSEKLHTTKASWFDKKVLDDGVEGKPDWLVDLLGELPSNTHYLENSSVEIDGVKIWGSPHTPAFGMGWGFNVERGYPINQIWNTIPEDTDIVITHGPMEFHCDLVRGWENVGCKELFNNMSKVKPHLHFCGHIHDSYGYRHIVGSDNWGNAYTFNVAVLNDDYSYRYKPVTLDYDFSSREFDFKM